MASVLQSPTQPVPSGASPLPLRDTIRALRAAFGRIRRPALAPTLLAKSVADHAACLFRRACTRTLSDEQWTRIIGEVEAATDFLDAAGWLKQPDRYHVEALDPPRERIRRARSLGREFEHLSFESGHEPRVGEPGKPAYSLDGKPRSGEQVRKGIVAADPKLLPLGTRIRVEGAGSYSGEYTVADTGRTIRGREIDIFIADDAEAKRFGRRQVEVEILGQGGGSGNLAGH